MQSKLPEALQVFSNEINAAKFVYTPESVREGAEKVAEAITLLKLALPFVTERTYPINNHPMRVRIYQPKPEHTLPVVIYFHGGGHLCGSLNTHDSLARRIAVASDSVVMTVDYRLAPEFPYPAGLEDCMAAFELRAALLEGIQADVDQVFLAGDSAGGNLALTVCHSMKEKGDEVIKGLALIYPSVDFTMQSDSIRRNGTGYLLTEEKMHWYFDHYFSNGGDRRKASPLFFEHLNLLPPLYIAVAEFDPLHDEGIAFANKVSALGVPVKLERFEGMIHVFAQLEKLVPEQVLRLVNSIGGYLNSCRQNS
jgi:acetyl esterase/lipase